MFDLFLEETEEKGLCTRLCLNEHISQMLGWKDEPTWEASNKCIHNWMKKLQLLPFFGFQVTFRAILTTESSQKNTKESDK